MFGFRKRKAQRGDMGLPPQQRHRGPVGASFAVKTVPPIASVALLDHEEPYRAGMRLPPGTYRVEVRSPGFDTALEQIEHGDSPTEVRVELRHLDQEGQYFTQGSHFEDLLRVQGMPSGVARHKGSGHKVWYFGRSTVKIDTRSGKVISWSNVDNLKAQLLPGGNVTDSPFFTKESHADDVLRLQGTPSSIEIYKGLNQEDWWFGSSSVVIGLHSRKVQKWVDRGNLKAAVTTGIHVTQASRFTMGSHCDDVQRLQGTPTEVNRYTGLGEEVWRYGLSTVVIDPKSRRVIGWYNSNDLKVQLLPGKNVSESAHFATGSPSDDVLRLQGTPASVHCYKGLDQEQWWFDGSSVTIGLRTRKVIEWNNLGNLKVQLPSDLRDL